MPCVIHGDGLARFVQGIEGKIELHAWEAEHDLHVLRPERVDERLPAGALYHLTMSHRTSHRHEDPSGRQSFGAPRARD